MSDYHDKCMWHLEQQMPTLLEKHHDLVMDTYVQTGGFCMALQSSTNESGTYRMLTEEGGTFLVFQYSADDVDDEGTEILITDDVDAAVDAFVYAKDDEPMLNVCDQCGRECGIICADCLVCPEPAGYWAWDSEQAQAYLAKIDRAADDVQNPQIAFALGAHHGAMLMYFKQAQIIRVAREED